MQFVKVICVCVCVMVVFCCCCCCCCFFVCFFFFGGGAINLLHLSKELIHIHLFLNKTKASYRLNHFHNITIHGNLTLRGFMLLRWESGIERYLIKWFSTRIIHIAMFTFLQNCFLSQLKWVLNINGKSFYQVLRLLYRRPFPVLP